MYGPTPIPSIWNVAPVDKEPHLALSDWSVYELNLAAFGEVRQVHVVGYNMRWGEGRVSSNIAEFDPVTRRVRTRSDRVYQLVGPPGKNMDADYVWSVWKRLQGAEDVVEVTETFAGQIEAGS